MEENINAKLDNFAAFLNGSTFEKNDKDETNLNELQTITFTECTIMESIALSFIISNQVVTIKFDGMEWNFVMDRSKAYNITDGYTFFYLKTEKQHEDTIDVIKTSETDDSQWKTFKCFVDKLVNHTEQRENNKNYIKTDQELCQSIMCEFRCHFAVRSNTYKSNITTVKMYETELKITVGNFTKIWTVGLKWECEKYEKNNLIFYNSNDINEYFMLKFYHELDEKNMLKIFKQLLGPTVSNIEIHEMKSLGLAGFSKKEFEFEQAEKEANVQRTVDELAPKIGGLIFPLSKGKKHFPFHTQFGVTTSSLHDYILPRVNENPPPHWRNCPNVANVTTKFIEGDPIEEYRGKKSVFITLNSNIVRTPLNRPAGFVQRQYEDYY